MTVSDRAARNYLWRTIALARNQQVPLVLIGSAARGKGSASVSDIDLLMVDGQQTNSASNGVHLMRLSRDELAQRVMAGDDFAQWTLRFGKPLTCQDEWNLLAEDLLERAPWPSVARKLKQLKNRLDLVEDLHAMGDHDAAWEEISSAVNIAARGILLRARRFPLSSPELADQLREIGETTMADAVAKARALEDIDSSDVEAMLGTVRKELADLERGVSGDIERMR